MINHYLGYCGPWLFSCVKNWWFLPHMFPPWSLLEECRGGIPRQIPPSTKTRSSRLDQRVQGAWSGQLVVGYDGMWPWLSPLSFESLSLKGGWMMDVPIWGRPKKYCRPNQCHRGCRISFCEGLIFFSYRLSLSEKRWISTLLATECHAELSLFFFVVVVVYSPLAWRRQWSIGVQTVQRPMDIATWCTFSRLWAIAHRLLLSWKNTWHWVCLESCTRSLQLQFRVALQKDLNVQWHIFLGQLKGEIIVCSPFPDLFSIPLRDLSGNLDAAVITRWSCPKDWADKLHTWSSPRTGPEAPSKWDIILRRWFREC